MFIELTTIRGEKVTFNIDNIVILSPDKKGTMIVDSNSIDFTVIEDYESIKRVLECKNV